MKRILTSLGLHRRQAIPVCLLLILSLGVLGHLCYQFWRWDRAVGRDIYYLWLDGKRILEGDNPYARILAGNLRENNKYPTYFPLFYLLSAFTQLAGLREFPQWLLFWRLALLGCHLAIAAAVSFPLYRRGWTGLALFAGLFYLFNRWSLWLLRDGQIDFLAILFLVTSLLLFRRSRRTSLVLLSLSLAVKQIAIFLVPLYLIWTWQSSRNGAGKRLILAGAVIFSVPLASSLPLLVWNAEGFCKSILFSVTRDAIDQFGAQSLDALLRLDGGAGRLPLCLLMGLVYWGAMRGQLGRFTSVLLVMAVFVDFNAVLFPQYLCWIVPLLPLAVWDRFAAAEGTASEAPAPAGSAEATVPFVPARGRAG
jgi:hypothetical protein